MVERWVSEHEAPITVIETAGGLFSPLGHGATNFELMQALRPDAVILVAPDRLGVLHDLTTTLSLAASRGGPPLGVVLSAPARRDASTGSNATEMAALGIAYPLALFPRAPIQSAATADAAQRVIAWVAGRGATVDGKAGDASAPSMAREAHHPARGRRERPKHTR
jgi:dethiobiotin synthetase